MDNVFERFPNISDSHEIKADINNPAIRLYGRRFYKDQTPVEYLAEFLMVFSSPKTLNGDGKNQFKIFFADDNEPLYIPEDHIAIKLFSFFPTSKLETRHPVHRKSYLDAIDTVKNHINASSDEKEEAVKLIQSFFNGLVGVSKNRTWVTYSFLPISSNLLAREVTWEHPKALKGKKGEVEDWESSTEYFADNSRNFMGRGGELLFLQIVNLSNNYESEEINNLINLTEYKHLKNHVNGIHSKLETSLKNFLDQTKEQLGQLTNFIENVLDKYKINDQPKPSRMGWVPVSTQTEALLFACEMENICSSNIGLLDKVKLLQTLFSMHVLRSLCFQARRIDSSEKETLYFIGNYTWVVTDPESKLGTPIRQIAQNSFSKIDAMLYRVLRNANLGSPTENELKNGDENVFKHFRKFSKEIGLVIPPKGQGQRFTLNQSLLRFLVAALIEPGERIRLNHFYQRVFAHYGIALGEQQLAVAMSWCDQESQNDGYAVSTNTVWVEEALQQGGFLVELSDAVSMVKNPGSKLISQHSA